MPPRDAHLLSPEFFDADRHPVISFKSTAMRPVDGSGLEVVGDLTIKGTTRPVGFAVEVGGLATDQWGVERLGLRAHARILRSDFGVAGADRLPGGVPLLSDEVHLIADLSAVPAAPSSR